MLFEIVMCLVSGIFALLVYLSYVSSARPKNFPPGPPALPIIGSLYHLSPDVYRQIPKVAKQYGNIFHVSLFTSNFVFLSGIELIKDVYRDRGTQFSNRLFFGTRLIVRGSLEGIIIAPYGPKWAAHRKLFNAAMRKMGLSKQGVEKCVSDELPFIYQALQMYCDKEGTFNPAEVLDFAAMNVILTISVGTRYDYGDPKFSDLISKSNAVFKNLNDSHDPFAFLYIIAPGLGKLWHSPNLKKVRQAYLELLNYFKNQMNEQKKKLNVDYPKGFIDHYLIEMKTDKLNYFTDDGLNYSLVDLFQAGTETSASTLKWAILYMVNNPHIQDKVQEEISNVLGHRQVTYEDKSRLPYCDATVLEVQRKATVVPLGVSHSPIQDETIAGYDIPKDTTILASLHSVHHSSKHWKNPTEFDPDNFLDDDGSVGIREAFFPYGGGRRICLGMEIAKMELFIFFVGIMQKFKFSLPQGVDKLSEDCFSGVTLTPNPYTIAIERR